MYYRDDGVCAGVRVRFVVLHTPGPRNPDVCFATTVEFIIISDQTY